MGHNNQRLLKAGFRNKLVAKLKSIDIKVTKNRMGAEKRDGGGGGGGAKKRKYGINTPGRSNANTFCLLFLSKHSKRRFK